MKILTIQTRINGKWNYKTNPDKKVVVLPTRAVLLAQLYDDIEYHKAKMQQVSMSYLIFKARSN